MTRALLCTSVGLAGCAAEYAISPVDVHPEAVTECAFEEVDGAPGFERYTCNPVFTASDEPWAEDGLSATTFGHTDLLGHPFYQLWYFAETDDGPTAGYATSPDGTTWTPHPDNPSWPATSRSDWDGGRIQAPEVAWDADLGGYVMMYGGISRNQDFFGIGIATSADGSNWALAAENPVMNLGFARGGAEVAWPLALDVNDDGAAAYLAGSTDGERYGLWRTESQTLSAWTEPLDEVMAPGRNGRFDDQGFLDAAIVEFDGEHHLFYVGFGDWIADGTIRYTTQMFVGHAISDDGGRSWDRVSTDPIPLHNDDRGLVSAIAARRVGPRILLWVTDRYPDLDVTGVGYFVYTPESARTETDEEGR